jgi:hypothetical protein
MSKALGNYASLVRGVSQQAPADRLEGQHGEVLNMINDPVRGLVRRNGSIIENQLLTPVLAGGVGDATADSFSYRTFSYQVDGRDLDLIYRSRLQVNTSANHLDGLMVYDKTPDIGTGFVEVVTDPTDTMDSYLAGGFSAMTTVGEYVILAGNAVRPEYSLAPQVTGQAWSNSGVAWVRGGAYARTYTIKAVKESTNVLYTASYTTMPSGYPGTLDTSSLDFDDPEYQKLLNDMTYAYNAAVNQHIADASESIVPSNIAQGLIDALTTAGFTGWTRNGSHLGSTDVSFMEVTDGGDGSLLVSLVTKTSAADEVTEMHYIGKVIQVMPKTADQGTYYLKAVPKDGEAGNSGIRPVIWQEAAGVIQTPTDIFAIGLYHEGKFYLATDAETLHDLILAETTDDIDVPGWIPSLVGDTDSAIPPHFYGRKITGLAVFQDRLCIISDAVVNMSRPGDYFNFYRGSVLTVADDDPIEAFALGTEGDTIRQAVVYDRNLILLGDRFHYIINGRQQQTPTSISIAVQYTIDNTANAKPVGAGQQVFCLKEDTQLAATRLMQTQAGVFQDSPQITDAARQLRDYVNGTPAEMVSLSNPEMLFVRTEHFLKSTGAFPRARPSGIYVYQYLDGPDGQRMVDAWGAWEWSLALGTPIGISATSTSDGIMIYTLAWGQNQSGVATRSIMAMSLSARSDPTGLPYLDGMRKAELASADGLLTTGAAPAVKARVYTAAGAGYSNATPSITDDSRFSGLEHPHYTVGDAPAETVDAFRWTGVQGWRSTYVAEYPTGNYGDLWTGIEFPAFVDITPPFVRDHKGKAKTWGRLTLGRLRATLTRTAGFEVTWIDHVGTQRTQHFEGEFERLRYAMNIWIGRDARQVQVRLAAIKWLPLTINALEWAGQWFEPLSRK